MEFEKERMGKHLLTNLYFGRKFPEESLQLGKSTGLKWRLQKYMSCSLLWSFRLVWSQEQGFALHLIGVIEEKVGNITLRSWFLQGKQVPKQNI